ncbi:MAG: ERF family protein, partial [Longimicrobiales bacterium]|nr:ERF family protein [Longimicrobiales bacterium]
CLLHKSGQWCKSTCHLPLGGKKDGHALKSATTYLRRIGIVAVLGLPEEDDDGNATSAVARKSAPAPKASKDDVKMYCDELRRADLDPKLCASFMSDHGRAPASELSGAQLHQRLTWLVNNASAVRSWGESR